MAQGCWDQQAWGQQNRDRDFLPLKTPLKPGPSGAVWEAWGISHILEEAELLKKLAFVVVDSFARRDWWWWRWRDPQLTFWWREDAVPLSPHPRLLLYSSLRYFFMGRSFLPHLLLMTFLEGSNDVLVPAGEGEPHVD